MITLVTVTRGRPELLRRCIQNVREQDFAGPLTHLIVVDDDEDYRPLADETRDRAHPDHPALTWHFATRSPGDRSGPPVLARLRNEAVRLAETPLVGFLDDDNLLERHHLSSLVKCMRMTGSPAVHSQRRLVHQDGLPYLDQLSPWKRNIAEAGARYAELRRHCVYVPRSNVIRDQVHPKDQADRIQMVDTSEWLFERSLLLGIPFTEDYDHEDWHNVTGEDNKLLASLVAAGVPIASSHMPTLCYTLGGYSNSHRDQTRDQTTEGTW